MSGSNFLVVAPNVGADTGQGNELALGGALEGAARTSREMATWVPSMRSPDQIINTGKPLADARGVDIAQNDGLALGAVSLFRDSMVGSQFRLNCKPALSVLNNELGRKSFDETWLKEFREVYEERFNLIGDSGNCWLDAARMNNLTSFVRLGVAGWVLTGEVLFSAEWIRDTIRPVKTACQMISPARLSNPDGISDTRFLRRGVVKDRNGAPLSYWIRSSHPNTYYPDQLDHTWRNIPAEFRWGRRQIIHIIEQLLPDQSRGVADMVASLKKFRMTKQYSELVLQNAVVQASYAAAIESELPSSDIVAAMGGAMAGSQQQAMLDVIASFMGALGTYLDGSKNIQVDGVAIPHLFPGTKLNIKPLGSPGGLGSDFEKSLHRHICANLGLSYEEFSRDFSEVSYAGARASMAISGRSIGAKKRVIADGIANAINELVFEEEMSNGRVPLPRGVTPDFFYRSLMKEAFCRASWTPSGTQQIDELKETQAAILRIKAGISTYEKECAKFGDDYREVFQQRAREEGIIQELNIPISFDASKDGGNDRQQTLTEDEGNDKPKPKPAKK